MSAADRRTSQERCSEPNGRDRVWSLHGSLTETLTAHEAARNGMRGDRAGRVATRVSVHGRRSRCRLFRFRPLGGRCRSRGRVRLYTALGIPNLVYVARPTSIPI